MSYTNLISAINTVITTNGSNEITGQVLRDLFVNNIVPQLGANHFKGIATPTTAPSATPQTDEWYLAFENGTYTNFNNLIVSGELVVLKYNTSSSNWEKAEIKVPIPENGTMQIAVSNKFSSNFDEFQSFNGGTLSLNNNRLQVTASASAKGVGIKPSFVENNTKHFVLVDIDLNNVTSVGFYNRWSNLIQEITTSGKYVIEFTSDNTGAFPFPLFSPNSSGVFYLNQCILLRDTDLRVYGLKSDIDTNTTSITNILSLLPESILSENFEGTTYHDDINSFNGGSLSLNQTDNRLEVTGSTSAKGFNIDNLDTNTDYLIEIDIDLNGLPYVRFCNYWNNEITRIETSGKHYIRFTNVQSGGFPDPLFTMDQAGTFYVNSLSVIKDEKYALYSELQNLSFDISGGNNDERIQLGVGASTNANRQIAIGNNANTDQTDGIVIGQDADGSHDGRYGCVSGNEHTTIGEESDGGGWRTTTVGGKARALGQSSTAVGAGAETTVSHGVAFGRGAMMDWFQNGIALGGVGNRKLYIGSGWAHRFRMPFSGISIGNATPSSDPISISGINAFDFRPHLYSASRTYLRYEEVVYNGQLYLSKVNSNTGNTPPTTEDTNWVKITDLILGHTEYYPPTAPVIYVNPITWVSGSNHSIGRVVSHSGSYYIRKAQTDNTTVPGSNADYVDVSSNFNNNRIECSYLKQHNPATYSQGEMTAKWECIWVSKTNGNNNVPPISRTDDANWHCIFNPTMSAWIIGLANVSSYDTRHEENVDGGDLYVDAGMATGTGKSGKVVIRTKKANGSVTDGNAQNLLENAAEFHAESGTDTRFRIIDNATGQMRDVKYYLDGSNRKILYID